MGKKMENKKPQLKDFILKWNEKNERMKIMCNILELKM
jgi:hypothetical protein